MCWVFGWMTLCCFFHWLQEASLKVCVCVCVRARTIKWTRSKVPAERLHKVHKNNAYRGTQISLLLVSIIKKNKKGERVCAYLGA